MKLVSRLLWCRPACIGHIIHTRLVTWLIQILWLVKEWQLYLRISTCNFVEISPKVHFRRPCSIFVYFTNCEDFVETSVSDIMNSIEIWLNIVFIDIGRSKLVCCCKNKCFSDGMIFCMTSPSKFSWSNSIVCCKYINSNCPFQCLVNTSLVTQWLSLEKLLIQFLSQNNRKLRHWIGNSREIYLENR